MSERDNRAPCFPRGASPLGPPMWISANMSPVSHDTYMITMVHACSMITSTCMRYDHSTCMYYDHKACCLDIAISLAACVAHAMSNRCLDVLSGLRC